MRALFGWRAGSTRADLKEVLEDSAAGDLGFSPEESTMLKNILGLRERRIDDVMVPRADIIAVQQDIPLGELVKMFENAGHSRLVVFNDTLDERTKAEIQDLEAEHFALHTRLLLGDEAYTDNQKKEIPPAVWPLADTHPGSGRKVLFVGVHARQILGWPTAEARMYLQDLLEHATRRENVYAHEWQVGDLVMWDNRSTLHRGRRYDISERRELRRTTVNDTPEAMLLAA